MFNLRFVFVFMGVVWGFGNFGKLRGKTRKGNFDPFKGEERSLYIK